MKKIWIIIVIVFIIVMFLYPPTKQSGTYCWKAGRFGRRRCSSRHSLDECYRPYFVYYKDNYHIAYGELTLQVLGCIFIGSLVYGTLNKNV